MDPLHPGLYEHLVTQLLARRIDALGRALDRDLTTLRGADAADRIALHLSHVIERACRFGRGEEDQKATLIEASLDSGPQGWGRRQRGIITKDARGTKGTKPIPRFCEAVETGLNGGRESPVGRMAVGDERVKSRRLRVVRRY
ncbi:MAG TPA: hypothetical protein VMM18_17270 [Gemmatimonadaceae bacterium]|nr:hypothetical protein [Gemmatimonadaceae bacterium]